MSAPSTEWSILSESPAQTDQIGRAIGACLEGGLIVCLSGDLGAGKTALAAGIGRGWGVREAIHSPTFVLIHEHRRERDYARLFHLDCYRLSGLADAYTLGLEDLFVSGNPMLIEWPERIAPLLPEYHLWVDLAPGEAEQARLITLRPVGAAYAALVGAIRARLEGR